MRPAAKPSIALMPANAIQERRKIARVDFRGRVEIAALTPPSAGRSPLVAASSELGPADSINLNEEGMCLRLQRELSIHAHVALRLFAEEHKRPFECTGRVAWVMQRLDLRDAPPFLYDIGVHFINPSSRLRGFASDLGLHMRAAGGSTASAKARLEPAMIRQRCYVPQVEQESTSPRRWHLVVTVDGAPCFSQRFASRREADDAWEDFQRRKAS